MGIAKFCARAARWIASSLVRCVDGRSSTRTRDLAWMLPALMLVASAPAEAAAVYFKSQSATSTGGAVVSGGTWTAGIEYEVSTINPPGGCGDAINKVELLEGTTVLATKTYTPRPNCGGGPEYYDDLRDDSLTYAFGVGTHSIRLKGAVRISVCEAVG